MPQLWTRGALLPSLRGARTTIARPRRTPDGVGCTRDRGPPAPTGIRRGHARGHRAGDRGGFGGAGCAVAMPHPARRQAPAPHATRGRMATYSRPTRQRRSIVRLRQVIPLGARLRGNSGLLASMQGFLREIPPGHHVHRPEQFDGLREFVPRLVHPPDLPVKPTDPQLALCQQRPHP